MINAAQTFAWKQLPEMAESCLILAFLQE